MLLEFTDISEMQVLEGEARCCFQLWSWEKQKGGGRVQTRAMYRKCKTLHSKNNVAAMYRTLASLYDRNSYKVST